MAILAFQKPDKVIMLESDDFRGKFEFRPLEPGYGVTIGNALRRILLNSLEGYAITSVKIENIEHEFDTMEGVVEDMTDIILNLKQVRFRKQIEDTDSEKISCSITGQSVFTAGDLNNFLNGFQVLNPEIEICHMDPSVTIKAEFNIEKGRGYIPAEENKKLSDSIGVIAIDSIHTPIKNVQYEIENYRVEQKTDYEKLLFDLKNNNLSSPIFTHHINYINKPYYKRQTPYLETELNQIVVDYIASMTDDYFIELYNYLFPSSTLQLKYKGYFN